MKEGKNGVTENTPKNILFGAGTIHKGLKYTPTGEYKLTADKKFQAGKTYYTKSGDVYTAVTENVGGDVAASTYYEKACAWNFAESLYGATSGGSKFSVAPQVVQLAVDGALVAVKGLNKKTGEVASMEVNFAEFTADLVKTTTLGELVTAEDETFDLVHAKSDIVEGDYWENIAFVGEIIGYGNGIFIMDNALCTDGLEIDAKNKEQAVVPAKFACNADIGGDLDKLPWRMCIPKKTA